MTLRPIRAIREINRTLSELERAELSAREEARLELARSATAYSKRTKEVVDGTMSLSAVLMRAGEVQEAKRLLARAHDDVRHEERALLETVHEVEVASATRREKMTRLKLAKMLATAMLGGAVMASSAVGVAVANYLTKEPPAPPGGSLTWAVAGPAEVPPALRKNIVLLSLGDWTLELSKKQYREYRKLVQERDSKELRSFLLSLLPPEAAGQLDIILAEAGLKPLVADVEGAVGRTGKRASGLVAQASSVARSSDDTDAPEAQAGSEGETKRDEKRADSPPEDEGEAGTAGCEEEPSKGDGAQATDMGPLKDVQEGCSPLDDVVTAD